MWNAALAVAALHKAGIPMNSDSVRYGLGKVDWPGRFEMIRPNVVLDGAHNPHAAGVLAATWKEKFGEQKAALVFSAVGGKDVAGILEILAPLASRIFFCPVDSPRAVSAEELASQSSDQAAVHHVFGNFRDAFAAACATGNPVLVAGSLFLVGEARAFLTDGDFQASSQ